MAKGLALGFKVLLELFKFTTSEEEDASGTTVELEGADPIRLEPSPNKLKETFLTGVEGVLVTGLAGVVVTGLEGVEVETTLGELGEVGELGELGRDKLLGSTLGELLIILADSVTLEEDVIFSEKVALSETLAEVFGTMVELLAPEVVLSGDSCESKSIASVSVLGIVIADIPLGPRAFVLLTDSIAAFLTSRALELFCGSTKAVKSADLTLLVISTTVSLALDPQFVTDL